MKITVAITGASGTLYAIRLLERLGKIPQVDKIAVVASRNGSEVAQYEIGDQWDKQFRESTKTEFFANDDFFVPIASGSAVYDAMVITPCSMGTVARIASGVSDNLITRAADVTLKERKKLIIVPRESPLSLIHLENMTRLARAGAIILPACPSFYSRPETTEQLVDTVTDRILAQLGIGDKEAYRWKESRH